MSVPTPVLICGPKVNVALQHLTVSSDVSGAYIETYTTYATIPALLTGVSGELKWLDEKMTSVASHAAYIAYRTDILATDRLTFNGRHYIIGMLVDPFNQMKMLKIMLKQQAE
jgi:SPP1 family predicted phage head-tail adaptor